MRILSLVLLLTACAGGGPSTDDTSTDTDDTSTDTDTGTVAPTLGFGLTVGGSHTCAHVDNGDVHCWGRSHLGQLGLMRNQDLGDDEAPMPSLVDVGAPVVSLAGGGLHTCALTEDGDVKCWGFADLGQLGYGNLDEVGLTDVPSDVGFVSIGGKAVEVEGGAMFTCALLDTGDVTCWGQNYGGWLGQGTENIGDNETPDSVGPIDLGGKATKIAVGRVHSCAVLEDSSLRCWGEGPATGHGPEGTFTGDNETPNEAGDPLGVPVDDVWVGGRVTCAQLTAGGLQCWGDGSDYELGRPGPTGQEVFGLEEIVTDASAGPIHDFGADVIGMAIGTHYTCALLETGNVKCWGQHWNGVLGRGQVGSIRVAVDAPDVALGGTVTQIDGKMLHSCARLGETGDITCWGQGLYGKLGYNSISDVGDDETPASVGQVGYR